MKLIKFQLIKKNESVYINPEQVVAVARCTRNSRTCESVIFVAGSIDHFEIECDLETAVERLMDAEPAPRKGKERKG